MKFTRGHQKKDVAAPRVGSVEEDEAQESDPLLFRQNPRGTIRSRRSPIQNQAALVVERMSADSSSNDATDPMRLPRVAVQARGWRGRRRTGDL